MSKCTYLMTKSTPFSAYRLLSSPSNKQIVFISSHGSPFSTLNTRKYTYTNRGLKLIFDEYPSLMLAYIWLFIDQIMIYISRQFNQTLHENIIKGSNTNHEKDQTGISGKNIWAASTYMHSGYCHALPSPSLIKFDWGVPYIIVKPTHPPGKV